MPHCNSGSTFDYSAIRKGFQPRLRLMRRRGWWGRRESDGRMLGSHRRLKTIYRTNKSSAYNAGRYRQQMEAAESRPYWKYLAVIDPKTREQHGALNGKVFPYDDEFWDYFYPPNGFNCRCSVRALSERKLKREGLKVEATKGDLLKVEKRIKRIDYRTGEVQYRNVDVHLYRGRNAAGRKFAVTPHPGFDYNPGKRRPKWDPLGPNPMEIPGKWTPTPAFRQRNWKDRGLKPAKEEKWDAPKIPRMRAAADAVKAKEQLATELPVGRMGTPVGDLVITEEGLEHIAKKREDARERYARHFRSALEDPDEVWLAFYPDKREYRRRFLKIFAGDKKTERIVVIARENADGYIVVTALISRRWEDIDGLRYGDLLYKKRRPAKTGRHPD